jgi:hypothetical protein
MIGALAKNDQLLRVCSWLPVRRDDGQKGTLLYSLLFRIVARKTCAAAVEVILRTSKL